MALSAAFRYTALAKQRTQLCPKSEACRVEQKWQCLWGMIKLLKNEPRVLSGKVRTSPDGRWSDGGTLSKWSSFSLLLFPQKSFGNRWLPLFGSPPCHFHHPTVMRCIDGRSLTVSDPPSREAENYWSFSPAGWAERGRGGAGWYGMLETEREGGFCQRNKASKSSGERGRAEKYLPSLCLLPSSSPVVLISSSRWVESGSLEGEQVHVRLAWAVVGLLSLLSLLSFFSPTFLFLSLLSHRHKLKQQELLHILEMQGSLCYGLHCKFVKGLQDYSSLYLTFFSSTTQNFWPLNSSVILYLFHRLHWIHFDHLV